MTCAFPGIHYPRVGELVGDDSPRGHRVGYVTAEQSVLHGWGRDELRGEGARVVRCSDADRIIEEHRQEESEDDGAQHRRFAHFFWASLQANRWPAIRVSGRRVIMEEYLALSSPPVTGPMRMRPRALTVTVSLVVVLLTLMPAVAGCEADTTSMQNPEMYDFPRMVVGAWVTHDSGDTVRAAFTDDGRWAMAEGDTGIQTRAGGTYRLDVESDGTGAYLTLLDATSQTSTTYDVWFVDDYLYIRAPGASGAYGQRFSRDEDVEWSF